MCGGRLEIAPCAHVGHVFRKTTPYSFPGGTGRVVNHNNARLAEVWLDDWKHFYYNINPGSGNGTAQSKWNLILSFIYERLYLFLNRLQPLKLSRAFSFQFYLPASKRSNMKVYAPIKFNYSYDFDSIFRLRPSFNMTELNRSFISVYFLITDARF